MKDFVPLGSGNSRFLKTVNNAKTLYPTYDAFLNALIAGTLPIDLNGINAAGVAQMGTALNKTNLLTDATAAALGLTGDPTVNDALGSLADMANWHVWESSATGYVASPDPNAYPRDGEQDGVYYKYVKQMGGAGVKIETGSYKGTGTYNSTTGRTTITFSALPKFVLITEATNYGSGYTSAPTLGNVWGLFDISAIEKGIITNGKGYASAYSYISDSKSSVKIYINGTTISFEASSSAAAQFNQPYTYFYIAIV